jgi:hypothetical protein
MMYQRKAHFLSRKHDRSATKLLKTQHFSNKASFVGAQ